MRLICEIQIQFELFELTANFDQFELNSNWPKTFRIQFEWSFEFEKLQSELIEIRSQFELQSFELSSRTAFPIS